ncbi:class I SAM-dependent methyltransferase [Amycolatopsis sp. FDAARGOS 1241]|uniref:class I SAM-dependent methyltransferase n=1 Tax=Amycolatopsis sp. FDAARGOS 1241 TaxID=2778070 RepID=UPI001950DF23|nr:class I SAM-dependent methyltransferase [Amycolatopsis sp. FDAARGOS 1241]QRP43240.1 methyltransferase domain-containing protein [Amycolatopsis sp. FDAARGOS 1241]
MDEWSAGAAYERYVGRWSRRVAAAFVDSTVVPPGAHWLDVGCGTGALTAAVLAADEPASVVGVDAAAPFVAYARRRVADPRATFAVADARALPVADRRFDAVVSGLALNFVPEPARAVAEWRRAAKPGAVVAAYVWDYADGMELMRWFWDAAAVLDPAVAELDEGRRFPLCRPDPLSRLWTDAGLTGVVVRAIQVPTAFAGFDDYWSPFLGGQGPAPGYAARLPEDHLRALRDLLQARLPIAADGSITLTARAWAVRGSVARR